MFHHQDYRDILKSIYAQRAGRNPSYSLRAFSRHLGIPVSRLSEILNYKAGISSSRANAIADRLQLPNLEKEYFICLVESIHARSPIQRKLAKIKLRKFGSGKFKRINMDVFNFVASWMDLAILEIIGLGHYPTNAHWLAKTLNISVDVVQDSIGRMVRLKLISKVKNSLVVREPFLATPDEIPSDSIKRFHEQILHKAVQNLFSDPLDVRDFSSVVMAIDKADISKAKEKIRAFRRQLTEELAASKNKNSVYCLSAQLFELVNLEGGRI